MRSISPLNGRWFFLPGDTANHRPPRFRDKDWQEVNLPNAPEYGFPERYWYCKAVQIERMPDERIYLRVDCPAANCRLFVNGTELEKLRGGVTHTVELTGHHRRHKPMQLAFRFNGALRFPEEDVQAAAALEPKLIVGKVLSEVGGFPRGIELITVPISHFSFDAKGGSGVSVQTELLENGSAKVKVNAAVLLPTEGQKITFAIGGPRIAVPVSVPAAEFAIPRPRLWSPADPFLYSLRAILTHKDGTHLDTVDVSFGVRDLRLTGGGAVWNGLHVLTHGLTRKTPAIGAALPHEKELALLREMGVDTLILTGTPEDDAFFGLCDASALRVFQTLPGLNGFRNRKDGLDAAKKLIFRLMNHPCAAGWAISAEGENDGSIRALCELIRHANTGRPILLTDCELAALNDWDDFPADAAAVKLSAEDDLIELEKLHRKRPKLSLGLTLETIGTDIGFAEALRDLPQTHPWLSVFSAGQLYAGEDSAALLSQKNEPKDEYYLMRALWGNGQRSPEEVGTIPAFPPFVHIRALDKDNPHRVVVYSNAVSVNLTLNGKAVGMQNTLGIFVFNGISLIDGANQALAKAGELTHARVLNN
ncbi:MAG: hypothetical protein LBT21_08110 [Oscillospiraceae bacterium]|nr:hypothetical protein [Oscillospiraceae bacterium]